MNLTKKQKEEIKKQEDCQHKNIKETKIKNNKMLCGYEIKKECLDCGCKFIPFKVEIAYILETIARNKNLKFIDEVTEEDLIKSGYVKPTPTKEQAEYLIKNKFKFI